MFELQKSSKIFTFAYINTTCILKQPARNNGINQANPNFYS